MKQFDLYEPTTVSEATGLLNQFGASAKLVAGGSDLLGGVMKDWVQGKGMPYPAQIVDLTTIPELMGIKSGADGFHIGANTTLTEVIEHPELTQKIPLLGAAAVTIASPSDPQLRHAGRQHQPAAAVLVLPRRELRLLQEGRRLLLRGHRRQSLPRDHRRRAVLHRPSVRQRHRAAGPRRFGDHRRPGRPDAHGQVRRLLPRPTRGRAHRERPQGQRSDDRSLHPDPSGRYEDGLEQAQGSPGLRLRAGLGCACSSPPTVGTGRMAGWCLVASRQCRTARRW